MRMQNGARVFAYITWVVMISLAIIVFSSRFLVYINVPGWVGLIALLAFGLVYLNFTYLTVRRFIRKVMGKNLLHYLLALLIWIPPAFWLIYVSEEIGSSRILTLVVFAFSCGLGAYYGYRSGKRLQLEYLQKNRTEHPTEATGQNHR